MVSRRHGDLYVWVLAGICFTGSLLSAFAAEPVAPRLFHSPNAINPKPDAAELEAAATQQAKKTGDSAVSKRLKTVARKTYRYDGFVSSAQGKHYLVNGKPIDASSSLVLLSVMDKGAVLEVRTAAGQVLRLSIGQVVNER